MEIKKYTRSFLFAFFILCTYTACKKDGGDADYANRPIVEAYLISGKQVSFKVYQQKGLLDTASYGAPIPGLSVTFSAGTKSISLKEQRPGVYVSDESNLVEPGTVCSFKFSYNGIEISGQTNVPDKPVNLQASALIQAVPVRNPDSAQKTFHPVTFSWNNPDNSNYLMVFKNQERTPNRIGDSFGRRDEYRDIEVYLPQTSLFKTQEQTFSFSGYYNTYLYHVNAEYNAILNGSSNSSLNLTNPPSNIKNGLGIFTAMSCDSLVLYVYKD